MLRAQSRILTSNSSRAKKVTTPNAQQNVGSDSFERDTMVIAVELKNKRRLGRCCPAPSRSGWRGNGKSNATDGFHQGGVAEARLGECDLSSPLPRHEAPARRHITNAPQFTTRSARRRSFHFLRWRFRRRCLIGIRKQIQFPLQRESESGKRTEGRLNASPIQSNSSTKPMN